MRACVRVSITNPSAHPLSRITVYNLTEPGIGNCRVSKGAAPPMLYKSFTAKDEEKTLCNKFKDCIGIEEALYHESEMGVIYFASTAATLAAYSETQNDGPYIKP